MIVGHGNSDGRGLPKKATFKNNFRPKFSASRKDVMVGYAVA